MSDYAIPESGSEPGPGPEGDRVPTRTERAAAQPTPAALPDSASAEPAAAAQAEDVDAAARSAEGTASLRMLLETAVARRSVDEIAKLVTLLRESEGLPEGADQALQAAAASRPIEDVISLAVLLADAQKQEPHTAQARQADGPPYDDDPPPEPQRPRPHPQQSGPEAALADRRTPAHEPRPPSPDLQYATRPPGAEEEVRVQASTPGRVLRWPVALTLAVCALLYAPRPPLGMPTGGLAWLMLGLAGGCLALGVLLLVGDRTWVWWTTTLVGIALVSLHALTATLNVNLLGRAVGALLPWPTGALILTAGLTAVLSVMALLYRSDRPHPGVAADLQGYAPTEADPHSPDSAHEPAVGLAPETGATAP
ncbi:hypothetical protein ACIPJK_29625 [Streptomyces roseus]|uniref:hypothetical protein n=1 Tax=Streptomyces roseus TaxID=66430 RepID=UPI00380DF944